MSINSRSASPTYVHRMLSRKRLYLLLLSLGLVWGITLVALTLSMASDGSNLSPSGYLLAEGSDRQVRKRILSLSKEYVHSMALSAQNAKDGPFNKHLTAYDLKKALAVLLDNLMHRMRKVEYQLKEINSVNQSYDDNHEENSSISEKIINARDLLLGQQEICNITKKQALLFPHCTDKMEWMTLHWQSDPCYARLGVDGTQCSFMVYLSEIESWCPKLTGRIVTNDTKNEMAAFNFDLRGLMMKLQDRGSRQNYAFIRNRISHLWPRFVQAAESIKQTQDMTKSIRKHILIHLGLLTRQSGFKIVESTEKGGPLGELVQWSDIISVLYILGHDLTFTSEVEQLHLILAQLPNVWSLCQSRHSLPIDVIVTDIVGLIQFKRKVKAGYGKFSCLLRIVDSFGTEPEFNFDLYAKKHHQKSQWGMHNLNPKQFFTMFPHSPDNSFMGFVVESYWNRSDHSNLKKKNQAVVYGKANEYWKGKTNFLKEISKHVEIHGTVYTRSKAVTSIPSFVVNHGLLSGAELHSLLRQSKLFIGLGFPYEGPAPLEALAQGAAFINPKFSPPHSRKNALFFQKKPTNRALTSQHPYAENFIGYPYVYTVDIDDMNAVNDAVLKALKSVDEGKVHPHLPFEYTEAGMLQRVNAYLNNQDFCSPTAPDWPSKSSVYEIVARNGQSCIQACHFKGLMCEPTHLKYVNTVHRIEKLTNFTCSSVRSASEIFLPAVQPSSRQCFLQNEPMLYSCAGSDPSFFRICSCRDFIKEQTALCSKCL